MRTVFYLLLSLSKWVVRQFFQFYDSSENISQFNNKYLNFKTRFILNFIKPQKSFSHHVEDCIDVTKDYKSFLKTLCDRVIFAFI